MKCSKNTLRLVIILLTLSFNHLIADSKWWEKAIKAFSTEKPSLSNIEISDAFKEALQIGSEVVVKRLGQEDGFNTDPIVHIPLPRNFKKVKKLLNKIGMSDSIDDLELKLNRAAELATPKAKILFIQSIKEMTFDDIQKIYKGPEDSATRYFQEKMTQGLMAAMTPIVDQSLAEVGAVKAYEKIIRKYNSLPFVRNIDNNLTQHVVNKGIEGIFYYIAKEEAAIRKDPLKQTTNLLKMVFGQ